MMVEAALPTRIYFRKECVVVKFPGQSRPLQVQRLDLPDEASMPSVEGGFRPFRPVINLKLVDANQPELELLTFDPPIEVRIRYTKDDLAKAEAAKGELSLGFWDGKQWIRFTPAKHQYHLELDTSPSAIGWCVVTLTQWGDPPVAVGT